MIRPPKCDSEGKGCPDHVYIHRTDRPIYGLQVLPLKPLVNNFPGYATSRSSPQTTQSPQATSKTLMSESSCPVTHAGMPESAAMWRYQR
jgi:hypothetical protein